MLDPLDPMTSYEQAESEATERTDEARREQHYADATRAARLVVQWNDTPPSRYRYMAVSQTIFQAMTEDDGVVAGASIESEVLILRAFVADYGTPALLRVIANALEAK